MKARDNNNKLDYKGWRKFNILSYWPDYRKSIHRIIYRKKLAGIHAPIKFLHPVKKIFFP